MTDDIFNELNNNTQETPENNVPEVKTLEDQLKEIKNPDGTQKYNNLEDAMKALKHAQSHIPTIQDENKQLKNKVSELMAEVDKRASVEDVVENFLKNKQEPPSPVTPEPVQFDPNKVVEIVNQVFEEKAKVSVVSENREKVNNFLVEKFGEKATEVVKSTIAELGISGEEFARLSGDSPQLVLSIFNQTKPISQSPTSTDLSITPKDKEDLSIPKPEKSLLQGATGKEQAENWKKLKEIKYKELGIES